jgi:hypothetical protein
MSTSSQVPQFDSSNILRIVAMISIFGFLFVTVGTVILMAIDNGRGPISLFFGLSGFAALVLICRHLLKLISTSPKVDHQNPSLPSSYAPPVVRGVTNRRLNEPVTPYQSIIEDPTQQFEAERRSK